jgi:hypothetical protein
MMLGKRTEYTQEKQVVIIVLILTIIVFLNQPL